MRFLVDSNVLSEPLRERPDWRVVEKLVRLEAHVATASVVLHELRFGAARLPPSRRRERVEAYLAQVFGSSLPILPYDREAAEWHATERARLEEGGVILGHADGQIAAIARTNGLILVTRNTRDFRALKDLKVASWHRERS